MRKIDIRTLVHADVSGASQIPGNLVLRVIARRWRELIYAARSDIGIIEVATLIYS